MAKHMPSHDRVKNTGWRGWDSWRGTCGVNQTLSKYPRRRFTVLSVSFALDTPKRRWAKALAFAFSHERATATPHRIFCLLYSSHCPKKIIQKTGFGTSFFRAMSQIASAATLGQPNGSLPEQGHAAMTMAYAAAATAAAAAGAGGVGDAGSGDGDEEFDDLPSVDDKRTKRGFSKRVTLRDLERYFEYPIEEVSKMMGVSTTIIKRLCRKYGIKRWPYRQVRHRACVSACVGLRIAAAAVAGDAVACVREKHFPNYRKIIKSFYCLCRQYTCNFDCLFVRRTLVNTYLCKMRFFTWKMATAPPHHLRAGACLHRISAVQVAGGLLPTL